MFISVNNVTCVKFNNPKLCVTSEVRQKSSKHQKTGQNIIRFFFHKINKNMQRKPGVKCFLPSLVCRHLRQIQNF